MNKLLYSILLMFFYANYSFSKIAYTFPEFPYKEKPKHDAAYQKFETACEGICDRVVGIYKRHCVTYCISPACYNILYYPDLLEEGEIDVRLISFKGCFIRKLFPSSSMVDD